MSALVAGCSSRPEVPVVRPQRVDLTSYLTTNGRTEPLEDAGVFAEISGVVEVVPVREGEHIKKRALLVRIDDKAARARLEQAQAKLRIARADLATIERGGTPAEIAELENQLAAAKRARDRTRGEIKSLERLAGKQAIPRSELEDARSALKSHEAQLGMLRTKLRVRAGTEKLEQAQARVREAEAAVELAAGAIEAASVRAGRGGVVYSLEVRPGDFVTPGAPLARIGKVDEVRAVIFVDEPELGRVRLGAPVTITTDAYPGREWTCTVDRLPTEIISLETRRVGEVWCTVNNAGGEIIPNLTVSVEIETAEVESALTVARQAIVRQGGQVFVWVAGPGGTAERREVELGIQDPTRVQILSGLEESDRVLLPGGLRLEPGQEVKPVGKTS